METALRRISLSSTTNLEKAVQELCANMDVGGFRLSATFVYGNELVLIFQQPGSE